MLLVIANKLYSSWSLRPWLLMKAKGIEFDEKVIPLAEPDTRQRILEHSPSGKVPVLIDGDTVVWETLAIIEHLAERYPERGIWPRDLKARSHARAISSEMHSGFTALRSGCGMNLGKKFADRDRGEAIAADVARITAIFSQARARFGQGGPFLFGEFSAADAMFAPVVTRFETYSIEVDQDTRAYMDAILGLPAFQEWLRGALEEPWVIAKYEADEPVAEVYRSVAP
jgi:glutathione S-transferase